ncbi:MAG: DUF1499 domain-containing protein [Rhodanobacteraceae bacterium]
MKFALIVPLLALIAIVLLLVSGPGVHMGWWDFMTGFKLLKWAAFAGIAAIVVGVLMLIVPATRRGHAAWLVISIIVGLSVAWMPWHWLQRAHTLPPIHDISTDTANPPPFVAVLPLRKGASNPAVYGGAKIAAQQQAGYPDVKPLHLDVAPAQAFQRALAAAKKMGWTIDAAVPADGRIEATATTAWFGFKDDIVVRVRADSSGSVVDVRSVSRVGESDVGTNAARVRKYLREIADVAEPGAQG